VSLLVVEAGQVDGAWDVVLGVLAGAANVDDFRKGLAEIL
jgi:hypothetical protein